MDARMDGKAKSFVFRAATRSLPVRWMVFACFLSLARQDSQSIGHLLNDPALWRADSVPLGYNRPSFVDAIRHRHSSSFVAFLATVGTIGSRVATGCRLSSGGVVSRSASADAKLSDETAGRSVPRAAFSARFVRADNCPRL